MKDQGQSILLDKLRRVGFHLRLHSVIQLALKCSMLCLIIYAAILLISRLTAVIPDVFEPWTVLLPFLLAILIALLFHKRYQIEDSAKLADEKLETKDLFYSASTSGKLYGEFASLLHNKAENNAEKIEPAKLINVNYAKPVMRLLLLVFFLVAGVFFLPQLDPFDKQVERKKIQAAKETIKKINKETKKRISMLKKSTDAENSPEIQKMLADIKQEFNSLKKSRVKANTEKLRQIQKTLGTAWKTKKNEQMREMLKTNIAKQNFGMLSKKEQQWRNGIKKNDFSSIKKEASELRKMAKQIAKMKNSQKRETMKKEFRKRLKALSDFMASQMGSKGAQGALKNALSQINSSTMKGLNKDAMNSAANSMEQFQRELDRLSQMSNDLKQLESAMKAAQLAEQLNRLKKMQNAKGQSLKNMQDYEQYYKQLMSQCKNGQCKNGNGNGKGKGKSGQPGGGGGFPEENKDAKTATKSEIAHSKLQSGKILMRWNVQGVGKNGTVREEYRKSVKKVKQGVSEAILKEQVPPGYHEAIQKYFDSL